MRKSTKLKIGIGSGLIIGAVAGLGAFTITNNVVFLIFAGAWLIFSSSIANILK